MSNCNSILGQILQLISRHDVQKSVKRHECEKHSKGFSSCNHFNQSPVLVSCNYCSSI
ncbi:MAG: DUF4372 domain-containing protein [bacterium]